MIMGAIQWPRNLTLPVLIDCCCTKCNKYQSEYNSINYRGRLKSIIIALCLRAPKHINANFRFVMIYVVCISETRILSFPSRPTAVGVGHVVDEVDPKQLPCLQGHYQP